MITSKELIKIFDGATGTELSKLPQAEHYSIDILNIVAPDAVRRLQADYVAAGADYITTNTFGTNPAKWESTRYSWQTVADAAIENAKAVANGASVIFDISPTGRLMEPIGEYTFQEAYNNFRQIVEYTASKVDGYLLETFADLYEIKAAILAIKENCSLPVFATMTFDSTLHTLSGSTPEIVALTLSSLGVDVLGVNCSESPNIVLEVVKRMKPFASVPLLAQANKGLPQLINGTVVYNYTDEMFAEWCGKFIEAGANIVGGCCGTSPSTIKIVADTYKNKPSKGVSTINGTYICSSTQLVKLDKGVICGERLNPTGKKKLKQALTEENYSYLQQEALAQKESGADFLDLNVGIPNCNETALLCNAVKKIQEVCDLPLQLDSSNSNALKEAIRLYNGVPMINSVNGDADSMNALLPLIARFNTPVVALPLNENGIPESAEGRVAIAKNIICEAERLGIDKRLLVFDGLVMAVSSNQQYGRITLDTLSALHNMGFLTTIGLSNVSFGLPERAYLNRTFLALALDNGLDIPIMNPLDKDTMEVVKSYMVLTGKDDKCQNYIDFNTIKEDTDNNETSLFDAIVNGLKEQISAGIEKELTLNDSDHIINNILIPALQEVGNRFEANKIFMPQLIRSAEAAKRAFDILAAEKSSKSSTEIQDKAPVIIATVKGDVHDIGKNIVKVVLESYGYPVKDLGKNVAKEDIYNTYLETGALAIGLSALMTTTVDSMRETIEYLHQNNVPCPIIVGGAVLTQDIATDIKADYYAKDALTAANILNELT